jgi:hypothetical protein
LNPGPIARHDRGSIHDVEPLRTDFTGYEGKYVAIDARTGEVVLADDDPRVVLEAAKKLDHVSVRGRVPYPSEPQYVGLG